MKKVGGYWVDKGVVPAGTALEIVLQGYGAVSVTLLNAAAGAAAPTLDWCDAHPTDISSQAAGVIWQAAGAGVAGSGAPAPEQWTRIAPTTGVRITASTVDCAYQIAQREQE